MPGWCQCCYSIDVNSIISPTALLKLNLKIKQHKGKFFQHSRVYRLIMGVWVLNAWNYFCTLCYGHVTPSKKHNNRSQQPTFLCITSFSVTTDFPWDSVFLYCSTGSMSQKTSTLELIVDRGFMDAKHASMYRKKFLFLRSWALKPWYLVQCSESGLSVMPWKRKN